MAKKQKRVFILGGGAALGAHHVGAMRLLDEQGIKPDAIVGSSIGVINACCYVSGGVPQLEEQRLRSIEDALLSSFRLILPPGPVVAAGLDGSIQQGHPPHWLQITVSN